MHWRDRDLRFGNLSFVFLCFLLIVFTGVPSYAQGYSETAEQEDIHPVIQISGNSDLLTKAAIHGWGGTGTEEDPIMIEGLRFLSDVHIFTIAHTDLYVNFTSNLVQGLHSPSKEG